MTRAAILLALLAGCHDAPPTLRLASATEVGTIPQGPVIQGRDGGHSAALWGHVVFNFGDTALNTPDVAGSQFHSNSAFFTDDRDAGDGLTGLSARVDTAQAPLLFVPNTPDEATYNAAHAGDPCQVMPCQARWAVWPGDLIYDAARDRALIVYQLVAAAPGDFNFHGVGQGLATWAAFDADVVRPDVRPGTAHPSLLFGPDEPTWGTATAVDGDFLYAFARIGEGFEPPCHLARVELANALDHEAWRYWDGASWSGDAAAATDLFACAPIMSVSRNAAAGGWLAIYSAPLSNDVRYRTAPDLTGPWSDAATAFTADRKGMGGTSYDALAHVEYASADGMTIYVTYSRSNGVPFFGSDLVLERVELR
jgi:hypothetical protein